MWKKMERQGGGVDSVYDAVALRVVIKAKREAGETDEAHEEKSRQLCYHVRSQEATCRPCCIPGMMLQDVHTCAPGIYINGGRVYSHSAPQYEEPNSPYIWRQWYMPPGKTRSCSPASRRQLTALGTGRFKRLTYCSDVAYIW